MPSASRRPAAPARAPAATARPTPWQAARKRSIGAAGYRGVESTSGHGPWDRRARPRATPSAARSPTPMPSPFWLDGPRPPTGSAAADGERRVRPGDRRRRAERALGALLASSATRAATVVLLERDRIGQRRERAQRRLHVLLPHPRGRQRAWPAFPTRCRRSSGSGSRTSPRSARPSSGSGSTASSSPPASSTSPSSRTRSSGSPRRPRRCARFGHEVDVLDREAVARRGPLAALRGRASGGGPAPRSSTRRSSAGASPARPSARACGSTRAPGAVGPLRAAPGSLLATDAGAVRARQVLLATSAFPAWSARSGAGSCPSGTTCWSPSRSSRAQRDAIGWANRQGIGDIANQFHYYRLTRRRPDPLGRLRRDLRLRQPLDHRARAARARASPTSPPTSSPRSRSSRGSASATAGAARSTPAAASSPSRARRWRPRRLHGRPHRARGRRQPLRRRDGARPARPAARPRPRGCARCGRSRSRSRPSRCAGRRSSSPATGSRRPTATAASAGCGCGRSTGSGSATTAELSPHRSAAVNLACARLRAMERRHPSDRTTNDERPAAAPPRPHHRRRPRALRAACSRSGPGSCAPRRCAT